MYATQATRKSIPTGIPCWISSTRPRQIWTARNITQAITARVSPIVARSSIVLSSPHCTTDPNLEFPTVRFTSSACNLSSSDSTSSSITSCLTLTGFASVSAFVSAVLLFSCWRSHCCCSVACHLGIMTLTISRNVLFHSCDNCTKLASSKLKAAIECWAIMRDRKINISRHSFRDSREHLVPGRRVDRETEE